jgi:acyl dehydratase
VDRDQGGRMTVVRELRPDAAEARRYAEASGDYNPIHVDQRAALESGLPGQIMHGFWTMAQLARAACEAAGAAPLELESISVEFRGYALVDGPLTLTAEPGGAGHCDLSAEQAGRLVATGGAVIAGVRHA